MEHAAGYPESPMEPDDAVYPCKGCGEILEEGKAFELAGNRWHIDCFRCNTCGTILDSDANLLLLGDGSLICNNCTYSCSVCANKIEDLAILTGDQAFCANCFKCRNCKKKIENLKYARTSQGIFCMECHESLMQRRRKKSQKNATTRHKHVPPPTSNAMLLDKSLPSLPPSAVDRSAAFPENSESPVSESYTETPTELAPNQRQRSANSRSRSDHGTNDVPRTAQKRPPYPRSHSSTSEKRHRANSHEEDRKENLAPPDQPSADRNSTHSDASGNGKDFFIPMKLDPIPAPGPSPIARRDNLDARSPPQLESKPTSKDYFSNKTAAIRARANEQEPVQKVSSAESAQGSRNSSQPSSPHIAHQYQDRGRQISSDLSNDINRKKMHHGNSISVHTMAKEPARESNGIEPRVRRNGDSLQSGRFMLQEVPKNKRSEKRNSKSDGQSPLVDRAGSVPKSNSAPVSTNTQVKEQQVIVPTQESPESSRSDATLSGSPFDMHGSRNQGSAEPHSSPLSTQLKNVPERGDSLAKSGHHAPPKRSGESAVTSKLATSVVVSDDGYDKPASAPPSTTISSGSISNKQGALRPLDSPLNGHPTEAPPQPPLRAKERLAVQQEDSSSDSFVTPRVPPYPPSGKTRNEALNFREGDYVISPRLPRYNDRDDIFVDDEPSARTSVHDAQQEQGSFLRRVSHSVRHARSYSDRGVRSSKEQKWGMPKSPMIGSHSLSLAQDISSPIASSPESRRDEIDRLKRELDMERQKTCDLEAALDAKSSIKQMNTELREKRSTMVVLDTQKEIVVRELDILTDHITAAKRSAEPLDVSKMTNLVLREFAQSLQSLKDSFQPQIEELTQRKSDLSDEIGNLGRQVDKSMQELEQISVKNAQLADLNNRLVHQVQELYKANAGPAVDALRPPNGLGIYNAHTPKDKSNASIDSRDQRPSIAESNMTGSTVVPEQEAEPAAYLAAPQVVNIRKAQPKKFNWKKGGQNVAKVTKGLKGAFSSEGNRNQREGQAGTEGMPYGAMSQQEHPRTDSYSKGSGQDRGPGFGGFFGNPKSRPQQWKNSPNNSYPAMSSDGPPSLFGSELEQRAEYERSNIPGIVMRCIQEVDARGMDVEGIYRKSGGNTQVTAIKDGFERSSDFDTSDPDLDINAVTSTLKQYLRKLPTPLITYEVYDRLIENATLHQNPDVDPGHPAHLSNPNNHVFKVRNMQHAINELPSHHRDTLEVLVFHLARVVEHERDNLMSALNTAVVFAPTIMRPESIARDMQDTAAKNAAIQFLIENCQGVFMGGGSESKGESE